MQVPCLPKKKWDLRERQRSNDCLVLVLVVVLVLESVRCVFLLNAEKADALILHYSNTPAARNRGRGRRRVRGRNPAERIAPSRAGARRASYLFSICYLLFAI